MPGSEVATREKREIVIPGTMEVLVLDDNERERTAMVCAARLDELRKLEAAIDTAKRELTAEVVYQASKLGVKDVPLGGRLVAKVIRSSKTTIDADVLERELRRAGMPEKRINEIITQTVTSQVDAREAKKAAGANPEYQAALAKASSTLASTPSVTIRTR